jgi:hypothetical protein
MNKTTSSGRDAHHPEAVSLGFAPGFQAEPRDAPGVEDDDDPQRRHGPGEVAEQDWADLNPCKQTDQREWPSGNTDGVGDAARMPMMAAAEHDFVAGQLFRQRQQGGDRGGHDQQALRPDQVCRAAGVPVMVCPNTRRNAKQRQTGGGRAPDSTSARRAALPLGCSVVMGLNSLRRRRSVNQFFAKRSPKMDTTRQSGSAGRKAGGNFSGQIPNFCAGRYRAEASGGAAGIKLVHSGSGK